MYMICTRSKTLKTIWFSVDHHHQQLTYEIVLNKDNLSLTTETISESSETTYVLSINETVDEKYILDMYLNSKFLRIWKIVSGMINQDCLKLFHYRNSRSAKQKSTIFQRSLYSNHLHHYHYYIMKHT